MGMIIAATRRNYSSFGGVMLWDAGNARGTYSMCPRSAEAPRCGVTSAVRICMLHADFGFFPSHPTPPAADNGNFDKQMKNFLVKGGSAPPSSPVPMSNPTSTASTNGSKTSSRSSKTISGFQTLRVSTTATADKTCHTPRNSREEARDS